MKRALLASAAVLMTWPSIVQAQPEGACDERTKIAEQLTDTYNEEPRVVGLNFVGNVMEIWASDAGTWTMVITKPDGEACVVSAGKGFDVIKAGRES